MAVSLRGRALLVELKKVVLNLHFLR